MIRRSAVALLIAATLVAAAAARQPAAPLVLGRPEQVAPGASLFRVSDRSLVGQAGPISALLLRIDPALVDLRVARAADAKPRREPVADIAKRLNAIAAINGGFFSLETGAPTGLLKVDGTLVRCPALPRAAIGLERDARSRRLRLLVDRVSCAGGRLAPQTTARPPWSRARDIVGGAGLLIQAGRGIDDWTVEKFGADFAGQRHPRTVVGAATDGTIWLIAVDGRQPDHSIGMTLAELVRLGTRLGFLDAVNLDGGGSTTMVVRGETVNRPSDASGARAVSDALVVVRRAPP